MKILIAGGTGFVGRTVMTTLSGQGHQISVLTRDIRNWTPPVSDITVLSYDNPQEDVWRKCIACHEAVINLAGASIFRLWNYSGKSAIYRSRMLTTQLLVDALTAFPETHTTLINCSGIGYYGFRDDEPLDEHGPPGVDFLAQVARAWEREALRARSPGRRVVLLRLGHVLGEQGGVLQKLKLLSRMHLLAPWGHGRQWFSWIHEQDVAAAVSFLLAHPAISGPVNLIAPHPVRNIEMTTSLNRLTGRNPLIKRIPAWLLRMGMGELSTLFLTGQQVVPAKLQEYGFDFLFPDLDAALTALIRKHSERSPA
jgi:uncharacterized protein (TIGR01777 family)